MRVSEKPDAPKIFQLLLSHPDINLDFTSADYFQYKIIHTVSSLGTPDIARLLLADSRIDPNLCTEEKESPLFVACNENNPEVAKVLLSDPRVDVNASEEPLFQTQTYRQDLEVLKILMDDGRADPNAVTKNDDTPLIISACLDGNTAVVQLLRTNNSVNDLFLEMTNGDKLIIATIEGDAAEVRKIL